MKTVSRLNAIFLSCRLMMSVSVLSILCLGCSAFDNEPPIPPKDYDLPPEIRTEVFSNELTGEVGDVDAFLDRIIKAGMVIHEGPNPPEIYTFSDLGAVNNRIAV